MNADYNDGSVWTAHSTAIPGADGRPVAAIRWYEIDVASRSVVQSGTYGTPERSTFLPTIGSDGDTTVIAHNVSGPDTFPRMDVAGRTAGHTQGELEDSITVESGKSAYDALAGDEERVTTTASPSTPRRAGSGPSASTHPTSTVPWRTSRATPTSPASQR
jgi:hypothetical protein